GHPVAGAVELGSGSEAGRTGADHRHLLTGALGGRLGDDPALLETLVDDGALDALDGHWRLIDAENTRPFTGSRADPAGKLREVVRLVQPVERFLPQVAVNEVVPLGNQVVDRAAGSHAFE